jgi:lysophospholipase L1-like esterase
MWKNTRLMVCTLTNDEPTNKLKDFLVSKNIKVIDFSEIWYDVTYSCHPKDNHPNHKAHKAFADSIFQYIRY